MSIIYSPDTTKAHKLFADWVNSLLLNYVQGFYDSLIQHIVTNFGVDSSKIFFQELYAPNGKDFYGYFIVDCYDMQNKVTYFFDSTGTPLYYNVGDIDNVIRVSSSGLVLEFFTSQAITFKDADGVNRRTLEIFLEDFFGYRYPKVILSNLTGGKLGHGILDVIYETRIDGAYAVYIEPDLNIEKYKVTNITEAKLDVSIPLYTNFEVPYEVQSKSSFYVPKTELSTYTLEQMRLLGSVTYKQL